MWRAYHSDVWPNRYLIDQNGDIVLHIEGEGNNRPTEEKIRELLAKSHPEVNQIPLDPPENTFAPSCVRRRGIGHQLTQTIIAWCRERGFEWIYLHASDQGRPLYESLGFVPCSEMRLKL
jgi:hypothetical protein